MIASPKPGRRVVLHYRASLRPFAPHGEAGTVVVASRGKPRNHLVLLDNGRYVVVPCGNLTDPPVTPPSGASTRFPRNPWGKRIRKIADPQPPDTIRHTKRGGNV